MNVCFCSDLNTKNIYIKTVVFIKVQILHKTVSPKQLILLASNKFLCSQLFNLIKLAIFFSPDEVNLKIFTLTIGCFFKKKKKKKKKKKGERERENML